MIVFGHSGFIGRSFVSHLERRGVPFMVASSKQCDLTDPDAVIRFLDAAEEKAASPLRVVMLSVIGKFVDNTITGYEGNVRMIANLIRGLEGRECASLVYASSTEVYGRPEVLPLTEETPLKPVDWYGLAKQTSEQMLLMDARIAPRTSLLRLPGIYGLTSEGPGVVDQMYQRVLAGKSITLHGDGTTLRDFVYVKDLNALIEELALRDRGVGVLNIASGKEISMAELISNMGNTVGKAPDIHHGTGDTDRAFDLVFDITKLKVHCPNTVPRSIGDHLKNFQQNN